MDKELNHFDELLKYKDMLPKEDQDNFDKIGHYMYDNLEQYLVVMENDEKENDEKEKL